MGIIVLLLQPFLSWDSLDSEKLSDSSVVTQPAFRLQVQCIPSPHICLFCSSAKKAPFSSNDLDAPSGTHGPDVIITWELVRNTESQTYWIRPCILTAPPRPAPDSLSAPWDLSRTAAQTIKGSWEKLLLQSPLAPVCRMEFCAGKSNFESVTFSS